MRLFWIFFALLIVSCQSCKDDNPNPQNPDDLLTDIPHNPTPKIVEIPEDFPPLDIPADNQLTEEGVMLGRMLFYDPILSIDSSMSCSSCHLQNGAFTDNFRTSRGVEGGFGNRSSMALQNLGFNREGFFWDGRTKTLEEQALLPVEDPIELHEDWENVEKKLRQHADYPKRFREAFDIESKTEITKELAAKAIAQFERTLIVGQNSRYYKYFQSPAPGNFPEDEESNGFDLFVKEGASGLPDAQCFHCHALPMTTDFTFRNNGLDSVANLADFPDLGRGGVTTFEQDNGKFIVPTLWNIELTAPYMHDGRFRTLEEVIDHYASGGHPSPNKDPLMNDIALSEENKADLVIFLKTFTDTISLKAEEFSNPFD